MRTPPATLTSPSSITIQGAGAGSTFVDGGSVDRVFDVAPIGGPAFTVVFSGLTIQNGKAFSTNFNVGGGMFINSNATVTISNSTLANNQSQASSGGAIENRGTLTLNTVTLQNNTALALGGAVNRRQRGALTVINSTFTGNKAESGGALYINTDVPSTASITGSTLQQSTRRWPRPAVWRTTAAPLPSTPTAQSTSAGSTFTGNSAAANGGAIYFNDSATQAAVATLTLSYNRIAGNTAAGGSGLFRASGTATAETNWWGCNTGPAAAPCDLVAGDADFHPLDRAQPHGQPHHDRHRPGGHAHRRLPARTPMASANAAGDLGALAGVPVTFGNAVLGTISSAQTTIQPNGAATATYTAGAPPGAGSAPPPWTVRRSSANLTINRPATTVVSITRSGDQPHQRR